MNQKPTRFPILVACLILPFSCFLAEAQTSTATAPADADTFVRADAPTNNYGGGGALSVSGSMSTNNVGQQTGVAATLMRFNTRNIDTTFDAVFGPGAWLVGQVDLLLTEMGSPDNAIFTEGIGTFEVRWISADNWLEGTGTPKNPQTNGAAWQDLPTLLNSNIDASLGAFTNSGASQQLAFRLSLAPQLVNDIRLGNEITFYLYPIDSAVGFTFNSHEFGNTNGWPQLRISAIANPFAALNFQVVSNGNAVLSFNTVSNWAYALEGSSFVNGPWETLASVPPAPSNAQHSIWVPTTNSCAYFRLCLAR